ncbi:hypothetical protein [Methylorubrum thiocyanatum]|uniref:hypothetical protein n=1 Tax=Methylorubrum thiocyanatum TaxID=47958 RepID=UPI003F7D0B22
MTRTVSICPALAGLALIAALGSAEAQTCAGVEHRVNVQTNVLTGDVSGTIASTQAAIIAQELAERARLVSAIRVLTGQAAAGSDQVSNGLRASSEALATTLVAQDQRQAVALASHRYGSIGYDPCGSNTKAQNLYRALSSASEQRRQIAAEVKAQPGRYADPANWSAEVKTGAAPDGASLYSGDTQAATKFIDTVVGPPDGRPVGATTTAEADLAKLEKTGRDSYRSLTANVLADIAADHAPDGPIARTRALATHWQGNDGGAAWSAGVARQHDRGLLQDAVRMEAANLALLATQLRRGVRLEATAAALLLSAVNARLSTITPMSSTPRRASFQP